MNNDDFNIKRLNIEIENVLYPLTSLLKQTNKPKSEIIIEIERFKEKYRNLILGLDRNYIENYLNRMYSKRNHGDMLIEIKECKEKEER